MSGRAGHNFDYMYCSPSSDLWKAAMDLDPHTHTHTTVTPHNTPHTHTMFALHYLLVLALSLRLRQVETAATAQAAVENFYFRNWNGGTGRRSFGPRPSPECKV